MALNLFLAKDSPCRPRNHVLVHKNMSSLRNLALTQDTKQSAPKIPLQVYLQSVLYY